MIHRKAKEQKMQNPLKSEFIGKNIEVISEKEDMMFKGIVLDETQHSFKIANNNKIKTILKKNNKFKIQNSEIINGSDIEMRPEDRIKKVKPNGKRN